MHPATNIFQTILCSSRLATFVIAVLTSILILYDLANVGCNILPIFQHSNQSNCQITKLYNLLLNIPICLSFIVIFSFELCFEKYRLLKKRCRIKEIIIELFFICVFILNSIIAILFAFKWDEYNLCIRKNLFISDFIKERSDYINNLSWFLIILWICNIFIAFLMILSIRKSHRAQTNMPPLEELNECKYFA